MKKVCRWFLTTLLALALVAASVALAEASPGATVAPVIDLTGIVNAVLAVLGALLTKRLLPWLKANTSARQQELTQAAVSTAVYAAEQLYNTNVIKDRMKYAGKWLEQQGYSVDRAQIEAEVKRQKDATRIFGLDEAVSADPQEGSAAGFDPPENAKGE